MHRFLWVLGWLLLSSVAVAQQPFGPVAPAQPDAAAQPPAGTSTGAAAVRAGEDAVPAGEDTVTSLDTLDQFVRNYRFGRIWNWLVVHGPSLLAVLIGMLVLQWLVTLVSNRIVETLTERALRGSQTERENRARTLSSVFHNTATTVIYVGALLIILDELGVPISTLLGGVAVFGLAVAFGAQNLIKDYFYGFMILLENQYGVNDVIRIAGVSGQVERITLRLTVLRDGEAVVHFIPHGEVKTVSNMTHGWSRAVFEIRINYEEDVEFVMGELLQIARELRQDPDFAQKILEDPEMQGVDSFGESYVVVKFFIKTRTMQQWSVKREMLRRIRRRFAELGIGVPYPKRTIVHQHEQDPSKSKDQTSRDN